MLDTSVYEVEFEDGYVEAYSANVIAEHLYSQIDDEGYHYLTLGDILDHKKDGSAVSVDDAYVTINGQQKL
jgi:hypothetical protein